MAKSETKESCFIIMPITTPKRLVEQYKDDADHFTHVLEHLFIPALKEAGFNPISPKSTGSNIIQADIIKQLSSCELVLCDMSILNPNVFYEFGIRTALDKPVALVVDNKTKPIPFDPSILNFHIYDCSVELWSIDKEKQALTKHVQAAYKKSKDHNALWKYFGVAQTGMFKPEEAEMGEKIDFIINKLSALEAEKEYESSNLVSNWVNPIQPMRTYPSITGLPLSYEKETVEEKLDSLLKLVETHLEKKAKKDKSQEPDSGDQ